MTRLLTSQASRWSRTIQSICSPTWTHILANEIKGAIERRIRRGHFSHYNFRGMEFYMNSRVCCMVSLGKNELLPLVYLYRQTGDWHWSSLSSIFLPVSCLLIYWFIHFSILLLALASLMILDITDDDLRCVSGSRSNRTIRFQIKSCVGSL